MLKYVATAIASVGLLGLLAVAVWSWVPASFEVRNESGQPVRDLTVAVAGKVYHFDRIPHGGSAAGRFHVNNEATLLVRGRLADGTPFGDWCGYVVWEDLAPHVGVVVRGGGSLDVR